MLYLDARAGNVDTAMLSCEAGSNASSMSEWDNTNSSQAYAGLGGQFRYATSTTLMVLLTDVA
jgi:hypothetical protein